MPQGGQDLFLGRPTCSCCRRSSLCIQKVTPPACSSTNRWLTFFGVLGQGQSAIAQWTGVPLPVVLDTVGLHSNAQFIVFCCVDEWWDSLDLFDALHPQTLLAMVRHDAPMRLHVERQLGYKSLKYISSLEVVTSVEHIGAGKGGGAAEGGYNWYVVF